MYVIIGHIFDKLVAKFEDHISTIQATDGMVSVNRERELGLERQLGNKKRTNDPTMLKSSKELKVAMPSDGGHRGHNLLAKGGGTHEPTRCKFKCGRYGRKGHVH